MFASRNIIVPVNRPIRPSPHPTASRTVLLAESGSTPNAKNERKKKHRSNLRSLRRQLCGGVQQETNHQSPSVPTCDSLQLNARSVTSSGKFNAWNMASQVPWGASSEAARDPHPFAHLTIYSSVACGKLRSFAKQDASSRVHLTSATLFNSCTTSNLSSAEQKLHPSELAGKKYRRDRRGRIQHPTLSAPSTIGSVDRPIH